MNELRSVLSERKVAIATSKEERLISAVSD